MKNGIEPVDDFHVRNYKDGEDKRLVYIKNNDWAGLEEERTPTTVEDYHNRFSKLQNNDHNLRKLLVKNNEIVGFIEATLVGDKYYVYYPSFTNNNRNPVYEDALCDELLKYLKLQDRRIIGFGNIDIPGLERFFERQQFQDKATIKHYGISTEKVKDCNHNYSVINFTPDLLDELIKIGSPLIQGNGYRRPKNKDEWEWCFENGEISSEDTLLVKEKGKAIAVIGLDGRHINPTASGEVEANILPIRSTHDLREVGSYLLGLLRPMIDEFNVDKLRLLCRTEETNQFAVDNDFNLIRADRYYYF